jgi:hypothetical protein
MTYSVYTCTGGKFNIEDWDNGKCFKLPEDDTKSDPDPSLGPGPNPNAKYIYNSDPGSQSAYKNAGLLSREELLALYNNYKPANTIAMLGNLNDGEYAKIQSDASSKSCKAKDISFLFSDATSKLDNFDEIRAQTHEEVQTLCNTYGTSTNFSTGEVGCAAAMIGEASGDMTHEGLISEEAKGKKVCNWESEGKCFPITYDPETKGEYFYNPVDALKQTKKRDGGLSNFIETTDICAELKNRTTCDNERRENVVDSVKNICRWTTGIGAFVDPLLNYSSANLCDEGLAYSRQVGKCKVNLGLKKAMGIHSEGAGSYTSNDSDYSQVQCAGFTKTFENGIAVDNYALVTRAQCDNSIVFKTDGNTKSCFFELEENSSQSRAYSLRDPYRLEKMGEFDIAKSLGTSANRRCTKDNNDIPCMQNQEDFVNCGTCVKHPAAEVSVNQKKIKQTTGDNFFPTTIRYPYTFSKNLNTGNDSIEITPRSLPYIAETSTSLASGMAGQWSGNTEPKDWTFDYEVYTIRGTNQEGEEEMLKICVRNVGDIRSESWNSYSQEPEMPPKIAGYLHDTRNLQKIRGGVQDNRHGYGTQKYNWGAADGYGYWYAVAHNGGDYPDNRYTKDDYKAHLDKFNNYNLEIRIHPDYENTYKFGMGTKDTKPTGDNVFNKWFFNRVLQLPIHESQIMIQYQQGSISGRVDGGLPEMYSFFKLDTVSRQTGMKTFPSDAKDYLYFHSATTEANQPQSVDTFKFKVNWAEIVTKIHVVPNCGDYNESRRVCAKQYKAGFRGGDESMCIYQPKVHCQGEWREPPTVVDDYGNNIPNTCGVAQPGVIIKQYVELSASKLEGINDVWNPGNYEAIKGAQCNEEDIGWLVYTDSAASASGTIATDTFRTETIDGSDNPKYAPYRKLPDGYTGTPSKGYWKRAVPKHGDLKYESCKSDCVEETRNSDCETPGDVPSISPNYSGTRAERTRMNFVVSEDTTDEFEVYDFSNAWYASENNCSGNFTNYKQIKIDERDPENIKMFYGQGPGAERCPNFTDEESRGNMSDSFDPFGQFTRGGACTIPKQNCIAGSSCIVNTDNITKLVGRINRGENLVKINNGTAGDDDSLEIEIDGTRYNKQNNITKEILFRLAKKECDRFGDILGFPNKAFCTEDKQIYISETDSTVPPCEYEKGSCYLEENTNSTAKSGTTKSTTYTSSAGIKVFFLRKREVIDGYKWEEKPKFIKPFEFCKWIDMPDVPSE